MRRKSPLLFLVPGLLAALLVAPAAEPPQASAGGAAADPRAIDGRPEGGFPYRLYLGASASAASPHRLVIWLHPTGGLMTKQMQNMAPVFTRHRLALLVMTDKPIQGWTDAEARVLFGKTLPEVAQVAGLDASRPLLFGFSAGGQLAVDLWRAAPALFGGVILDAAYPVDQVDGKQSLVTPPKGGEGPRAPFFVLVGGADPVAKAWTKVEAAWREAGIPLTIHRVSGRKHEWLFGPEETKALEAWLDQVVAPPQEEPAPAVHP